MTNKYFNKWSLTAIAGIFLLCVVVYYSRQYKIDTLQSQVIHQTKIINSLSPAPIQNKVAFSEEVPSSAKSVIYRTNNYLFVRKLTYGIVGDAIGIADDYHDHLISDVSHDGQYATYLGYNSPQSSIYNNTMAGYGHQFYLVNIGTGETQTITSNSFGQAHITGFSFTKDSKQIFISLEDNSLYFYNINNHIFTQIYKPTIKPADVEFCSGFRLLDISPNRQNLLIGSRCFEGINYQLLNINTRQLTSLGGGYGEGITIIERFIDDNSLFAWTDEYQDGKYINKYLQINLKGNKTADILKSSIEPSNLGVYIYGDQSFIAPSKYKSNPELIPVEDRQILGTKLSNIYFK